MAISANRSEASAHPSEQDVEEYFAALEDLVADLVRRGYAIDGLEEWCRRWLLAWNGFDMPAVLTCVAPDVVWDDPLFFGESISGLESFRAYGQVFWEAVPDLQLYPQGQPMIHVGRTELRISQAWRAVGTWTAPLPTWPITPGRALAPTGGAIDFEGVDQYAFALDSEGKVDWHVTRGQSQYCLANVLNQVGLLPSPGTAAMAPVRVFLGVVASAQRFRRNRR